MVIEEKDRLGNKLRDLEKAREDQWAAQRDNELLEKIRQKRQELQQAASEAASQGVAICPHCHQALTPLERAGFRMLACPQNDGAWLDQKVLERLLPK
ncbi:MAG TPA: zf-TFIIB domain-containing protein [Candidatus Binataceae bacterium]|nr:zf-TFIIB domain-containing protein [Candidatus Binataceae bacterium]